LGTDPTSYFQQVTSPLLCGLATEQIARAFLITPSTLAQRIVRAKAKPIFDSKEQFFELLMS
jgi:predicted RNA polymerase sigma factor